VPHARGQSPRPGRVEHRPRPERDLRAALHLGGVRQRLLPGRGRSSGLRLAPNAAGDASPVPDLGLSLGDRSIRAQLSGPHGGDAGPVAARVAVRRRADGLWRPGLPLVEEPAEDIDLSPLANGPEAQALPTWSALRPKQPRAWSTGDGRTDGQRSP